MRVSNDNGRFIARMRRPLLFFINYKRRLFCDSNVGVGIAQYNLMIFIE